jgi:RND family efflux transporter MFP subunit
MLEPLIDSSWCAMAESGRVNKIQRGGCRVVAVFSGPSGAASILCLAALWLVPGAAAQPGNGGFRPASIEVAQVYRIHRSASETFIGTTTPIRRSTIGSQIGGRVVEVFVEEGQHVGITDETSEFDGSRLGEPLVQLQTTTQDLEIEAAEVELSLRQLKVEELEVSLPLDIEQAQANVKEIQSRLEYARLVHERYRDLANRNGASDRELQEAEADFKAQTELLASAEANLRRLVATQDSRLAQAEASVRSQVAEIRRLREARHNHTIRAPYDGYVVTRSVDLGQWVTPGQNIAELVQLDPIELVINIPQGFAHAVQRLLDQSDAQGYPVTVTIDSLDQTFEGRLWQMVPQADLRSRAFPVKIRLNNPVEGGRHLIQSGMLGKASVSVGDQAEILVVKKDALVLGRQSVVYVVVTDPATNGSIARPVEVELGASLGEWIEVRGLLNEGDRVAVLGNERLFPGQPVQIVAEQSDPPPNDSPDTVSPESDSLPSS